MSTNNEQQQLRDLENGTNSHPQSSVPSILFITFVVFMLMNGRGDEYANTREAYANGLQSLNYQLSNLSAWLNGTDTNFTLPVEDPNTMSLASAFLSFGHEIDPHIGSYYSNMTGFWHADTLFHNLTALNATEQTSPWRQSSDRFISTTNLTAIPDLADSWNWTRSDKLSVNVGDKLILLKVEKGEERRNIAIIHGKVDLLDPHESDSMRLDFEGIHIVSTGTVYALAESSGSGIDLRSLPALVPEELRNDSARAVESELEVRIAKLKEKIALGTLEQDSSSVDDSPKSKCSFRLLGQLDSTTVPKKLMDELEKEYDDPTGITTVKAPEFAFDGVLLSQNCGIMYEIKHAVGTQTQKLYGKITTYAGISTLVHLVLLVLFRRQATQSSSAAGLSRVSRYTFLIQSLIDALSFVGHVTVAILADGRPSLSVLAPAGVACLLFIYEAQFSVLIGQLQAPEDAPAPGFAAPAPAPQPQSSTNTGDIAPGAATTASPAPTAASPAATAPAQPSFMRFLWTHIRTDPAARLWTLMSLCLIVVFRIVILLSVPLFFIGSLYSCMWMMQIYRSAHRARSSGLSWVYLVGTTLGRLFFTCYFLGCPKNIFDVEPRMWIYAVALVMLAQVLIILLQEYVDPAFFLPHRMAPVQTHDYHPAIPLPDPEAPEHSLGDCAICMDAIVVDPRPKSSDGRDGLGVVFGMGKVRGSARKTYSLAPCHHLFHTECLERWLAIKNICPQCRRPLPPI